MEIYQIAIYGGGGFAREVAWLVESCHTPETPYSVACFIDDNPALHGQSINGIPVFSLEEVSQRYSRVRVLAAIGAPRTRQIVAEKAAAAGLEFVSMVHPRVERSRWITMGSGTVICAGNILTTNIVLGNHVQINLDCTIGHDVIMGDYSTLAPGVHISGWVHLGQRVYIGTGANIINGTQEKPLVIGDDAVVGAGACVVRSVPAGVTVAGVPARLLAR